MSKKEDHDINSYVKIETPMVLIDVLHDLKYLLEKHIHLLNMWSTYYTEWSNHKVLMEDPKENKKITQKILDLKHDIAQYGQYLEKSENPDQETEIKLLKKNLEKELANIPEVGSSFKRTSIGLSLNTKIVQLIKDRNELVNKILSSDDLKKIGRGKVQDLNDAVNLFYHTEGQKTQALLVETNHLCYLVTKK